MKYFILPMVFANTNAGSKLYVCATPQNEDLTQTDYEALTWVEIGLVGNRGEQGKITNILNYPVWGTTVTQKAKGMTDAGGGDLRVARDYNDAGQVILRAAAEDIGVNNNYAFKELRADGPEAGLGTVRYNRGLVTGPRSPGGANEDFDEEIFTLAFQQTEIVVDPLASGVAPTLTVAPTITGTLEVGETITLGNGTFTGDATISYEKQLFAGGVQVAGATGGTFVLTSAQLGKVLQLRVRASNASGFAFGYSAVSTAVAP